MPTSEQLRAARAALKMEQRTLADLAGVPVQTLKRYEGGSGPLRGNYDNISSLIRVLEGVGIEFLDEIPSEHSDIAFEKGPGIRINIAYQTSLDL